MGQKWEIRCDLRFKPKSLANVLMISGLWPDIECLPNDFFFALVPNCVNNTSILDAGGKYGGSGCCVVYVVRYWRPNVGCWRECDGPCARPAPGEKNALILFVASCKSSNIGIAGKNSASNLGHNSNNEYYAYPSAKSYGEFEENCMNVLCWRGSKKWTKVVKNCC